MIGREIGLTALLKKIDVGLYTTTCICHCLSLAIVNTIKILFKKTNDKDNEITEKTNDNEIIEIITEKDQSTQNQDFSEDSGILSSDVTIQNFDIFQFINIDAKYFNYSYKRNLDYQVFKQKFLQQKKAENLYLDINMFRKFQRYCQTRWLSMGECLDIIIPQ